MGALQDAIGPSLGASLANCIIQLFRIIFAPTIYLEYMDDIIPPLS
jgi:hypothetical protein